MLRSIKDPTLLPSRNYIPNISDPNPPPSSEQDITRQCPNCNSSSFRIQFLRVKSLQCNPQNHSSYSKSLDVSSFNQVTTSANVPVGTIVEKHWSRIVWLMILLLPYFESVASEASVRKPGERGIVGFCRPPELSWAPLGPTFSGICGYSGI